MIRQRVQYIEIDVPVCSLAYGVAPCTAAIGVTGPTKCVNTRKSCQDIANYTDSTTTLRFAVDVGGFLPRSISAITNIESHDDISFTAGEISLGQTLGTRSSLRVTFRDHPHSDVGPGYDPYSAERGYDPFRRGTHWGKFRARQPYLQGRPIRWIQGFADQALADMDTRHFFIESFDGPSLDGRYSLTAKDILKFLDDDRALAPRPNNGELATVALGASDVFATLQPAGIGDAEYPAVGYVTIGGAESVAYSRAGDVLTIVRGRLGTVAAAHDQGDRIQTLLRFDQQKVTDIIYELMTEYAGINPAYIDLDDWHDEDDAYIGRLYTGNIAEPTAVRKLVNELIEQCGLAIWWDDLAQKIRFQALRKILTTAGRITPSNVDEGSLNIREQPAKRLSEMLVNYGLRSPLHPLGEFTSYRESRFLRSGQAAEDYGAPAFKEVFSRWIARFQTNTASRVGAIQIGRFRDPPRKFSFSMFRQEGGMVVEQGVGYLLAGWPMQDGSGAQVDVPIQITRLNPLPDRFMIDAEEMTFADLDLGDIGDPDPPPPPDSPVALPSTLRVMCYAATGAHLGTLTVNASVPATVASVTSNVFTGVINEAGGSAPAWPAGTVSASVDVGFSSTATQGLYVSSFWFIGDDEYPGNISTAPTYAAAGGTHEAINVGDYIYVINHSLSQLVKFDKELKKVATLNLDAYPHDIVRLGDDLWIASQNAFTVQRVNITSFTVVNTYAIPGSRWGFGLATDGARLWCGAGTTAQGPTLYQVNTTTGAFTSLTTDVNDGGDTNIPVRFADGSVWSAHLTNGQVKRINPTGGATIATIGCGLGPIYGLGVGEGWVFANCREGIAQIDPETNTVVARYRYRETSNGQSNVEVLNGRAYGGSGNGVIICDLEARTSSELVLESGSAKWVRAMPDGRSLVTGAYAGPWMFLLG